MHRLFFENSLQINFIDMPGCLNISSEHHLEHLVCVLFAVTGCARL